MWATVLVGCQPEVWDAWICKFELAEYLSDNGTAEEIVPTVEETVPLWADSLHWAFNSVPVTEGLCTFEWHEKIKYIQYTLYGKERSLGLFQQRQRKKLFIFPVE